jgi:hypothetical protein
LTWQEERLLAVQDRRVVTAGESPAVDLPGPQVQLHAPQESRVGIGLEVGIDQVCDRAGVAMELDQVGAVDLAQVGAGAALIDPEQGVERIERAPMHVEGIGQELAYRGLPACLVDRRGVAGLEEPLVDPASGAGVAAEERPISRCKPLGRAVIGGRRRNRPRVK